MDFVHGGDPYVRRRLYILSKVEGIYSAKETKEIDVCLLELRRRRKRRRVAFTEGICSLSKFRLLSGASFDIGPTTSPNFESRVQYL